MLKKKDRGEYGYLRYRKTTLTFGLFGVLLASLAIFFTGLLVNDWEKANFFTIVSILGVLPGAKLLTLLIVLFPHKQIKEDEKAFLDGLVRDNDKVFYDVVFTSKESPMHLDAIIVTEHQIVGYTTENKDKIDKTEQYFKNELNIRKLDYVCFLTKSEQVLKSRLDRRGETGALSEKQAHDQQTVVDFIRTAIV